MGGRARALWAARGGGGADMPRRQGWVMYVWPTTLGTTAPAAAATRSAIAATSTYEQNNAVPLCLLWEAGSITCPHLP